MGVNGQQAAGDDALEPFYAPAHMSPCPYGRKRLVKECLGLWAAGSKRRCRKAFLRTCSHALLTQWKNKAGSRHAHKYKWLQASLPPKPVSSAIVDCLLVATSVRTCRSGPLAGVDMPMKAGFQLFGSRHNVRNQTTRAHGVVVSHPLRMRKALGSNPSVSKQHFVW